MKKKLLLVIAACATIPVCLLLYSKLGVDGETKFSGSRIFVEVVQGNPNLGTNSCGDLVSCEVISSEIFFKSKVVPLFQTGDPESLLIYIPSMIRMDMRQGIGIPTAKPRLNV